MMQKAHVRATSQYPDWGTNLGPRRSLAVRKAELGYDRTKLKIHHRHPALLRRSECAGPNAEQWLTDLHLQGRDRMLHSGAALNHPHTTQRNTHRDTHSERKP